MAIPHGSELEDALQQINSTFILKRLRGVFEAYGLSISALDEERLEQSIRLPFEIETELKSPCEIAGSLFFSVLKTKIAETEEQDLVVAHFVCATFLVFFGSDLDFDLADENSWAFLQVLQSGINGERLDVFSIIHDICEHSHAIGA